MLALYLSMLDTNDERDKMTTIYEDNHLFCISIAMKITGNMAMAEDAVHNAFIEIIKRKEKYFALDGSVLRASLVIIVKNKAIDLLRERKRIVDDPIDGVEGYPDTDEFPILEQLSARETYESLRTAIGSLGDIHKSVLRMKYFEDLSNAEIAERLGITKKHVETRLYRAKEFLKKAMVSEGKVNE